MFDININFIASLPKRIKKYVSGIFFTLGKKNCSQIAKETNSTRKQVSEAFENTSESIKDIRKQLLILSKTIPDGSKKVFVIDDTLIKKIFGEKIEGRSLGYDSSLKKSFQGLTMVVAGISWAHGFFPLDFSYWYSEEIMGTSYKKKWQLALDLIIETFKHTGKMIVVTDAWYFSAKMAKALINLEIQFVMKAKSNINILHNGVKAQLKAHPDLRLYRNERKKTIHAEYQGMKLYFTAEKLRMKNGEWGYRYFASNFKASAKEYIEIYNLRWPIETCNRTSKQICGIQDCQMRSIEKQRVHALSVYLAYAQATYIKHVEHFSNTEEVFHVARDLKFKKQSFQYNDSVIIR